MTRLSKALRAARRSGTVCARDSSIGASDAARTAIRSAVNVNRSPAAGTFPRATRCTTPVPAADLAERLTLLAIPSELIDAIAEDFNNAA